MWALPYACAKNSRQWILKKYGLRSLHHHGPCTRNSVKYWLLVTRTVDWCWTDHNMTTIRTTIHFYLAVQSLAVETVVSLVLCCRQPDHTYKLMTSAQTVSIHPSSCLVSRQPELILFNSMTRTRRVYARDVLSIEESWLPELVPKFFHHIETK